MCLSRLHTPANAIKITRLLIVHIVLLVSLFLFSTCTKRPDQKAYEEVLATMSMNKAKRFFDTYPQSQYRDRLVDDIIAWCKAEDTESCYKAILEVLPKDHSRYKELAVYYQTRFVTGDSG